MPDTILSTSCMLFHSLFMTTMSLALLQLSLRDEEMGAQNGQVICPGSHSIRRDTVGFTTKQLGSRVHMLSTRLYC